MPEQTQIIRIPAVKQDKMFRICKNNGQCGLVKQTYEKRIDEMHTSEMSKKE